MNKEFNTFLPGIVLNPLKVTVQKRLKPVMRSVSIRFPSRLNAMAIDPSKIATNDNMVFTPGEIIFSVRLYNKITIRVNSKKNSIYISQKSKRKILIYHAVLLMRKALNVNDGLDIIVDNQGELKHCGLGSSSALISGVAAAVNEIYGKPVSATDLVPYLAQNHGEEIDGENKYIQQVQCIGGSAASGMFSGGVLILAGQSKLIKSAKIPKDYWVIIGIPQKYEDKDAKTLMHEEEKNLEKFVNTGKRWGNVIAYRILHEVLPSLNENKLNVIGDLIYDYRFKMGSIKNCSFIYPPMLNIADKLKVLKEENIADVLALSSVGPAFFAITKNKNETINIFKKLNLKIYITKIENNKYKVLNKEI